MSETDSEAAALAPVHTFASLAVRNYRLLFLGSLTSNVGTWMARVAQDWLVLTQLTDNSATALGYVTALQFAPGVLISPIAGAVADRFGKRSIMMVTQAGTGLVFAALTALVATGTVQLVRLASKYGEEEWADTSMLPNDVQVKFKLALTGVGKL